MTALLGHTSSEEVVTEGRLEVWGNFLQGNGGIESQFAGRVGVLASVSKMATSSISDCLTQISPVVLPQKALPKHQ